MSTEWERRIWKRSSDKYCEKFNVNENNKIIDDRSLKTMMLLKLLIKAYEFFLGE